MADGKTTTQSRLLRDLKKCQQLVEQVTESLQNQRAILRQRGMTLPPLVTSTLDSVNTDIQKLTESLLDDQSELRQLRALASMSAEINTSLDVDKVLQDTMDVVLTLTRAERGYLILFNPNTSELTFRIIREDVPGSMGATPPGQAPQVSMTILREVLLHRRPLLADNAYKDQRFQQQQSIAGMSLRSVICVPLSYRDEVLGVVYVDNRLQSGVFTDRELNTLTAFANTAAVAIANARLYTEIQRLLREITSVKDLMDDVFTSIASGVIATDADNLITTFNRAAADLLDLAPDDSLGRPLTTVLPRLGANLEDALVTIQQQGASQLIESELETAQGRRALTIKLNPLRAMESEQSGEVRGVAVVLDDVTEKLAHDQQIRVTKTYLPPQMVDRIHEISNLGLGGMRREVTCMFAEVRAIATLANLRPREALDVLNVYLSVATDCIHAEGGIVDKYMGSEVMALFNTQLNPQEDHATRAARCALAMREAFLRLYAEEGIQSDPHTYRVGIHSGVATLGNVGSLVRRDFTAIGDTINTAKRLEENAASGQIILSEMTRAALDAETRALCQEMGLLQVKGRQQGIRVYEVHNAHD